MSYYIKGDNLIFLINNKKITIPIEENEIEKIRTIQDLHILLKKKKRLAIITSKKGEKHL